MFMVTDSLVVKFFDDVFLRVVSVDMDQSDKFGDVGIVDSTAFVELPAVASPHLIIKAVHYNFIR